MRYTLLFWLPYYYNKSIGLSVAHAALVASLFEVGSAVGVLLFGHVSDTLEDGQQGVACVSLAVASTLLLLLCIYLTPISLALNVAVMTVFGGTTAALDAALAATAAQDVSRDSGLGTAVVGTATGIIVGMGSCGSVLQGWLATEVTRVFGWTGLFHVLALLTLASACALVPHASDQSQIAFLRRREESCDAMEMQGLVTIDPVSGADVGVFTMPSLKQAPRSRAWWFGVSGLVGVAIALSWLSQAAYESIPTEAVVVH